MSFVKAERKKAKLRLAISGPSGSGKTYSALLLAKGLGGKISVIDTERGSASMYSHLVDFDVMELKDPFSPERYINAIKEAEQAGYNTLVIDSITPEWSGIGGILQLNQQIADAKFRGNTWSAWSETDPRHRHFIDAMLQSNLHIIVTMRSKTETAQEKDEKTGRTKVIQLGMKAEQRDNIIYEFTTVLDLVHDKHYANATKDRTGIFMGADPEVISEKTGTKILTWLNSGVDVQPPPKPEQTLVEVAASIAEQLKNADDVLTLDEIWLNNTVSLKKIADALPKHYDRLAEIKLNRKGKLDEKMLGDMINDDLDKMSMPPIPENMRRV